MKVLTELCQELHNWFVLDKVFGTVTISGGSITIDGEAPALLQNQYFRIVGSVFNDGVHKYGDQTDTLTDETFDGAIWLMGVPKAVIDLASEIAAWVAKYGGAEGVATSPFASESFGGYSYSKATFSSSGGSGAATWQTVFKSRLNAWRKI